MNKTLLTLFALGGALILGLFVFILVYNFSVPQNNELSNQDPTQTVTAISVADAPASVEPTPTMAAALSPRQQKCRGGAPVGGRVRSGHPGRNAERQF